MNWLRFDWPGFNEHAVYIPDIEPGTLPSRTEKTNDEETSEKQQTFEAEAVPLPHPTVSTAHLLR